MTMAWIEIITLLALAQLLYFGGLVARARGRYGVKAPAIIGHEIFERYYRVQMNTIETLIVFLPSLWLAAMHCPPVYVALIGLIYLIGRFVYQWSYVRDPGKRSLGYNLSVIPALVLLIIALVGAVRALLH
jgi:glutathione S-transferase